MSYHRNGLRDQRFPMSIQRSDKKRLWVGHTLSRSTFRHLGFSIRLRIQSPLHAVFNGLDRIQNRLSQIEWLSGIRLPIDLLKRPAIYGCLQIKKLAFTLTGADRSKRDGALKFRSGYLSFPKTWLPKTWLPKTPRIKPWCFFWSTDSEQSRKSVIRFLLCCCNRVKFVCRETNILRCKEIDRADCCVGDIRIF